CGGSRSCRSRRDSRGRSIIFERCCYDSRAGVRAGRRGVVSTPPVAAGRRQSGRRDGGATLPKGAAMTRRLLLGFVAGFIATLVFHQIALWILHYFHYIDRAPWSMKPVPPWGVPAVISLAFL